jgi:hypothetical protein
MFDPKHISVLLIARCPRLENLEARLNTEEKNVSLPELRM